MLERNKIDLTTAERDQFIWEMGSKYFCINEFIKMTKLDWRLFSHSEDPWRLNPVDK